MGGVEGTVEKASVGSGGLKELGKLGTDEPISIGGDGSDNLLLAFWGSLRMVVEAVAMSIVVVAMALPVLVAIVMTIVVSAMVVVLLEATPLGAWRCIGSWSF